MKRLFLLTFSFNLLLLSEQTLAAACCGGGFASPSLIAGDDRAQLTSSLAWTDVAIDNVDSKGIWRRRDEHQTVQTLRLEGAHIISDRWQAGFTMPMIQRSHFGQSFSGLGDTAASMGYEYLPDWDYNPWRPKGLAFMQLVLPTGKSRAESDNGGLDSRGNGFWALGAGTLLTKSVRVFDFFSSLEIHRSFEKSIRTSQVEGTLSPGWGGQLGVGGGYNLKSWRFGTSLTWNYEDSVSFSSQSATQGVIPGSVERYATAIASVSYLANDEWAGTFSYSDQTLIGNPVNTSLGRGIAAQVQRRWGR